MNPAVEQLDDTKFRVTIDEREYNAYLAKQGVVRNGRRTYFTIAEHEWALQRCRKAVAHEAKRVILQKTSLGAFFNRLPPRSHQKRPTSVKPSARNGRGLREYQVGFNVRFREKKHAVLFKLTYC
jgi:hypothetical protein